jgi:hypothetical protein
MHAKAESLVCSSFCITLPTALILEEENGEASVVLLAYRFSTQIHLSSRSWYNHRHYAVTGVPQDDHSWPFSHSGVSGVTQPVQMMKLRRITFQSRGFTSPHIRYTF